MIEDANELEDGANLAADICIVGAGAAGITIARAFIGDSRSVLVIESGGFKPDAATQSLYDGESADERLHTPPQWYRQRRFGGSTTIWGGRCVPFDPIDFETRDYLPNSGWPIDYEAMAPFYAEANQICEAGEFAYGAQAALGAASRPIIQGFASPIVTSDTLERFSRPTDFGRRFRAELAQARNIRVVLNANCTEIALSADGGRVESLALRTLGGKTFRATGTCVVLATGGLEVARLLLASRAVQKDGIGNAQDLVGRYYMCHIAGTLGTLDVARPRAEVWHGYEVSREGIYCRRRFAISAATQRELGIGNVIARLHHPRMTDPAHGSAVLSALFLARAMLRFEYGKRLYDVEPSLALSLRHAKNVAARPFELVGFLSHWMRARVLAARKFPSVIIHPRSNRFTLEFHAEQQPNPESRVSLSDSLDALGMPRLRVDWRYSAFDLHTIKTAYAVLAAELQRSGVARLTYPQDGLDAEIVREGAYGGHHLGTARMGASRATGVVDGDCRVHDVDNLMIAGGAVFATSSQANPTLTIVALALRLAAHLKRVLPAAQAARPPQAAAPPVASPAASYSIRTP